MKFAIIGLGYIAPKHLHAIKVLGHDLICAYDPRDSVGILDYYFPRCAFFTEFVDFDNFCDRMSPDFLVICSPSHTHLSYIKWGRNRAMTIICEKPLVLSGRDLKGLDEKVNVILQLRHHPSILGLDIRDRWNEVSIVYSAPRGKWYDASWKGDFRKSGGVALNIGVHLFDLACYLFGSPIEIIARVDSARTSRGEARLKNGRVKWFLSLDEEHPMREFTINGQTIDLSVGFQDLHVKCYNAILEGKGSHPDSCKDAYRFIEGGRYLC